MDFKFKRDQFKDNRWTHSRIVNLHCRVCDNLFAIYQKDWPWNLRRLYMDRILYPENLVGLDKKDIKRVNILTCSNCWEDIWTPYIYVKENRKAFKVYQDMIVKKIRKLKDI